MVLPVLPDVQFPILFRIHQFPQAVAHLSDIHIPMVQQSHLPFHLLADLLTPIRLVPARVRFGTSLLVTQLRPIALELLVEQPR